MKRVLVTGATGFLGRWVLHTLGLRAPAPTVDVLLRDPAGLGSAPWVRPLPAVNVIPGDVKDAESLAERFAPGTFDTVFHLAAVVRHSRRDPSDIYIANVKGTRAVARFAAQQGARLVFVSTSGTVGCFNTPDAAADENAPYQLDRVRRWPYYHSKIEAEEAVREVAAQTGLRAVVIRPPVLLGPGDDRGRSTGHVIKFLRRSYPFLIHGGMHFIDVRDAAAAIVRAAEIANPAAVYHLAGTAEPIGAFFARVTAVTGVQPPAFTLPGGLAQVLVKAATALGLRGLPDPVLVEMASAWWGLASIRAEADLGYRSRDPNETLADTIDYIRAHPPAHGPTRG